MSLFVVVVFCIVAAIFDFIIITYTARAFNPPCLQILRIDWEGMIDDEISHGT